MTTTEHSIPAALYLRISQDAEETGLGIERQREDCTALAESKGWRIVETYIDNDVSATSGKPRPAYERMAAEVEAGRIRGIVVWDVDRLTRTPLELEGVIKWAENHRLHLASVGGEIDLSTPQGQMTARIKGAVARQETDQMSRRIRRSREQMAKAGEWRGQRPYGWDVAEDKRLVINEAEAAVIREGYKRLLAGEAVFTVASDWNRRGILTIKGNPWSTASVRSVLKRWRNCGVSIYKGREVGTGVWEPIVDRDTHERLLAMLSDPSRRPANRGTAVKYLLTYLVSCGDCGAGLAGSRARSYRVDGGKHVRDFPASYKCPRPGCQRVTRRMDEIDDYVTRYVLALLEREGVTVLGGDAEAAEAARARVEALEAKLSIVADQFAEDLVTAEQMRRVTAKLRPQVEEARAELHRALPASDPLTEFAGPNAREAWEAADIEQRRAVVQLLIDAGLRIHVHRVGKRAAWGRAAEFDPETVVFEWSRHAE